MSSTTLPVCPKTGSTSPSLTVHLCLHTAPGNRECGEPGSARRHHEKNLDDVKQDIRDVKQDVRMVTSHMLNRAPPPDA